MAVTGWGGSGNNPCQFINCYAAGKVTAVWGPCGFVNYITDDDVFTNCYTCNELVQTDHLDDIWLYGFGSEYHLANPVYNNCFWNSDLANYGEGEDLIGITTAQMKDIATFSEWNIGGTTTDLNNGYPFLSWQLGNSPIWSILEEMILPVNTDLEIVALEALRNIEMSAMGSVYTDELGNLVYKSRYGRNP